MKTIRDIFNEMEPERVRIEQRKKSMKTLTDAYETIADELGDLSKPKTKQKLRDFEAKLKHLKSVTGSNVILDNAESELEQKELDKLNSVREKINKCINADLSLIGELIRRQPQKNNNQIFQATRAGIAIALIYLERFGELPSQRNHVNTFAEKYKTNPNNTLASYDTFNDFKDILFAGLTDNRNSTNGRLNALKNALSILRNENNSKAIEVLEKDISRFKNHYKI